MEVDDVEFVGAPAERIEHDEVAGRVVADAGQPQTLPGAGTSSAEVRRSPKRRVTW